MGRYTRFAGVRGVERDVWELIQWHALHDEGRRRLGRPEDDRALFAKFLSFRECISHFGGKSDNALLVLGDRHPCSWWYVLEKFTEVRHWRCHRNHPLPNRLDAILPDSTVPSMPHGAAQIKEQTVVGQFAWAAG